MFSKTTLSFKKEFYPKLKNNLWQDWHWQLANMLDTFDEFNKVFKLDDEVKNNFINNQRLPIGITPFMASLMWNSGNPNVLSKLHIPHKYENILSLGEELDPLGEEDDMKVSGLIHKYPDRVLFLVTNFCGAYCRYCTRSRLVGKPNINNKIVWQKAIDYISQHNEIRDVLISGGDPLTLSDENIEWLLSSLRSIKHIEIIRIGTRAMVTMPMRITKNLVSILKKHNPVFLSGHFSHRLELVTEVCDACNKLADNGILIGSQTVLLKGVNDDAETIKDLMLVLLKCRVKPYYLFHCDPVQGSYPFRCKIEKGIEIIKSLRGQISGYAIPTFAIDTKGGGKIPILPDYIEEKADDYFLVKNYEGKIFKIFN